MRGSNNGRGEDIDRIDPGAGKLFGGAADFVWSCAAPNDEIDPETTRHHLKLRTGRNGAGIGEDSDPRGLRYRLMQQLEPLHVEFAGEDADPGRVAAGPRH